MLSQTLHTLAQRASLAPKDIAALLGTKLGPARQPTPERTEYDVVTTQVITAGRIATANQWCMIALRFAPALGLTLQDLEPLFLDAPYRMTIATAQRSDGVAITSLDHQFLVPAGMLVVRVPPAPPSLPTHGEEVGRAYGDRWDTVAGKRTATDPVIEIVLTTQPRPGLDKEPTLRAFRDQVRKSEAARR